ncbi:MAG: zf-HC2 domain-containing protein [Endomicrobiales bacterium]|nr:zf-HC2 domain-containing protein [Endomicrobiales bacterium]
MNCKTIQELLITDYIDNELDSNSKKEIEKHLESCVKCREFYQNVYKVSVEPFRNSKDAVIPEELWQSVKASIQREEKETILEKFRKKLIGILVFPRIAVAASIVLFVVVSVSYFYISRDSEVGIYVAEQKQEVTYSDVQDEFYQSFDVAENDSMLYEDNFETIIEETFL